jgi:signal transduction histidine kinase
MRKLSFWILFIVITISLAGLIILQSIWIKNSITQNRLLFENQVNSALSEIVSSLEKEETVLYISNELQSVNSSDNNLIENKKIQPGQGPIKVNKEVILQNKAFSNKGKVTAKISVIPDEKKKEYYQDTIKMKTNGVNSDYAMSIYQKAKLVERIVNRMINSHLEIEERIPKKVLEQTITAELVLKGITIPYEYAVKDESGDIHLRSPNYNDSGKFHKFIVRLYPNDIFNHPYFLYVYFPFANQYLYKSISTMLIASLTLTLIIILVIAYAVYIILKQKKLSEIKNDFINNMTHELKTPISTISLASQLLADKSVPIENKNIDHLSKLLLDESKRLSEHVEKVLHMAVSEKNNPKLKLKKININDLIDQIANNFNLQVKSRNGRLFKELNAENPLIYADETHLTNIIINLLDNALKYSDKEPLITIYTKNYENGVVVEVKDNGIGISKDHIKKIFDQFYRIPTGNIHNVKGFGLGLSYVKKMVDAHNGKITVDSKIGVGSTFSIYFPFEPK